MRALLSGPQQWAEVFETTPGGRYFVERMSRIVAKRSENEGVAKSLLAVLGARGLQVSPEEQQRILACKDEALLLRWLQHAATANTLADVFGS